MTQKRWMLCLLTSLLLQPVAAQTLFQHAYDHNFFEQVVAVEQLGSGNRILAGFTSELNNPQKKVWLTRVNNNGNMLWSKTLDLPGSCSATAIQQTLDGNLVVAYNSYGASPAQTTGGWLKITPDGLLVWAKKTSVFTSITNICATSVGDLILTGQYFPSNGPASAALAIRIDLDGNLLWSASFGGSNTGILHDCWEGPQGILYCCGAVSDANEDLNGFWAKLGPNGSLVAPIRRFFSSMAEELTRIVPYGTLGNRLLMSGYSRGFVNSAYASIWTVEVDFEGNYKSSNLLSMAEKNIVTNDLIALPGNQYLFATGLLTGQLSRAMLVKTSVELEQLFAYAYKGIGEADLFFQVLPVETGYLAAGSTRFLSGNTNGYLVTVDVNGLLNNNDCCPEPVNFTRTAITVPSDVFVPVQQAPVAAVPINVAAADVVLTLHDLCVQIAAGLAISSDTICPGACVQVTLTDSMPGITYSFDVLGGQFDPAKPGMLCHTEGAAIFVTLTASNGICAKKLTRRIEAGLQSDQFPNAFTPNGDGSNDVFAPIFGCGVSSMRLRVFNRWGQKVFETTDPARGWDGRYEGVDLPSEVYVWTLDYTVDTASDKTSLVQRGSLTLIR